MLRTKPFTSSQGAARVRRGHFTLIELMVAMVVLVVLMGMLFAIMSGAQEAYSLADSNARIYEKAHILFEQLSRDLRSAVVSDMRGREVPIWIAPASGPGSHQPDAATPQQDMICFVSAGDPYNAHGQTRTNKVRYSFHTRDGVQYANTIRRSIDADQMTPPPSPNWNPRWDFYGKTLSNQNLSSGIPDWVSSAGSRRQLVGGVVDFSITPYPDTPTTRGTRNVLPQAFVVTVTFVDERALSLPEPLRTQRLDESRRTFRKIIFAGGEG